ncbi:MULTISPECIES: acyl-CoA thioesterase [unclassified Streptomyces]|uniref:acyl-CoA thioesterase n=1 Tax=unclassified Streptomyces TaxID=2593676 RepID=UPI003808CDD9
MTLTPTHPATPVWPLADLMTLDETAPDTFRGRLTPPSAMPTVFGGQIVAQALAAAGRTVAPGREPHSLHGYFLFPGDAAVPITYRVERVRDGHSFTNRRVVAVQQDRGDREVFHLTVSFQRASALRDLDHQTPMPAAPAPETLAAASEVPPAHVHPAVIQRLREARHAVDVRYVYDAPFPGAPDGDRPATRVWFRTRHAPDGPGAGRHLLHQCLVAYLSDLTLLDAASPYHRTGQRADGKGVAVSLDHAMWFHRPLRADEWLLYEQQSPSASDGRGLVHARIYTADGRLAASVVQEGVIRLRASARQPLPALDAHDPDIDPFSWRFAKPETD